MKFCVLFLIAITASASAVTVTNLKNGDTIRYELALIKGTLSDGATELNIQREGDKESIPALVHEGKFKALIPLKPGNNPLRLLPNVSDKIKTFQLNYEPQTNAHFVRLIWFTDKSGEETFATPDDKTIQDYEGRLRTAGLLMQTFTAEKMNESGHGRRTFKLERDEKGAIIIHKLKGERSKDYYYNLGDSGHYWNKVRSEVNRAFPDKVSKNVVLAAFTRKDSKTGKMKGHTALGGANLGLFGSASIFSWPRSVEEAQAAFLSEKAFDASKVHDDSISRSNYWGLASTTMGATLHELSHTLGLFHTGDPRAIMSRGFDNFNRAFTFCDPPTKRSKKAYYFPPEKEAYFSPAYAASLKWNRWFTLEKTAYLGSTPPKATYYHDRETIEFKSGQGIRWIGLITGKDKVEIFRQYDGPTPPKSLTIKLSEFEAELKGRKIDGIDFRSGNGIQARLNMPKK
ncbi:metallopeptidase [bacterium]|nr:metallopeptidase [bacterium]MDB2428856.1 hypothetical protein [Akkermansiaceae bacterium]MDG1071406.1 hypothetical protein [Akkermansiaceae bacterium]MDG2324107.1 hypothetical protein [Akkermansiaceae bacterium]